MHEQEDRATVHRRAQGGEIEMLKKKAEEQGAEFVSFDAVSGEWKFRVRHPFRVGVGLLQCQFHQCRLPMGGIGKRKAYQSGGAPSEAFRSRDEVIHALKSKGTA